MDPFQIFSIAVKISGEAIRGVVIPFLACIQSSQSSARCQISFQCKYMGVPQFTMNIRLFLRVLITLVYSARFAVGQTSHDPTPFNIVGTVNGCVSNLITLITC